MTPINQTYQYIAMAFGKKSNANLSMDKNIIVRSKANYETKKHSLPICFLIHLRLL